MKKLLDTDFKDARQTLSEGDPLEEYLFEDEREAWAEGDWREVGKENMRWRFSADSETVKVEAEFSGHHDYPETAWLIVYDREGLSMPLPAMYVSKQSSMETYRGYLLSPWPCPACEPSSSIFPNLNDRPNRTVRAR